MDRVRQMEVFIQVMESGNFTRAASVLGLPRSTVTNVIQALEDRVGTQLLLRSTRQMMPTDEGHKFLTKAREIVEAVYETDRMFLPEDDKLQGRFRVDVPNRIGRRIVVPALPAFIDLHPELQIELSTTDSMVDLIAEGLDCIIRIGIPDDSRIICAKLGELQMINCCSPGYLQQHGPLQTSEQLAGHRMIKYGPSLPTRPASFVHKALNLGVQVPVSETVTVNNAEAYIAAARAGFGIIQIQAFEVQDHLKSGEMVAVLEDMAPPPMQLSFLYARKRNIPARVDLFKSWIGGVFQRAGLFDRYEI